MRGQKMKKHIQVFIIGCLIFTGSFASANSIESSTLHFKGALEDLGNGVYVGTIAMTKGEYYVPGGGGQDISDQGGFDIYAQQDACALVEGYYGSGDWNCYDEDTYTIGSESPNDAYTTPGGPRGSSFDPDVADYGSYELVLTAPTDGSPAYWYLRHNDGWFGWGNATPMSGVMDWEKMYAYEDDAGAYIYPWEDPNVNDGGAAAFGAGPGYWDMDWSWGSEAIPLAFPGFRVEVIQESDGNYHVILTPGDPVDEDVVAQEAPIEVPSPCSPEADWKNHGEYVHCVARYYLKRFTQGFITEEEIEEMISAAAAARSDVGKKRAFKHKLHDDDQDFDNHRDDRKSKKLKRKKRR